MRRNNKILLISSHLNYRTGLNTHMTAMYRFLEKMDYSPAYCCITGPRTKPGVMNRGMRYHDIVGAEKYLSRVIAAERPSVVITFNDLWKLFPILEAKKNYPFYWIHHFLLEEGTLGTDMVRADNHGIYTVDLIKMLKAADAVVPATTLTKQVTDKWKLPNVTEVVLPFLDPGRVKFSKKGRDRFREDIGVREDDYLFTVVARNFARKNMPAVFRAFSLFMKGIDIVKHSRVFMYVHSMPINPIGWDLRFLAEHNGLKDEVIMRNPESYNSEESDSTMSDIYSATDCFLNVSYAEGLGYPVAEAMLAGCPIICSGGGYPKTMVPKDDNIIVEPSGEFIPYNCGFSQVWWNTDEEALAKNMAIMYARGQNRVKRNMSAILSHFPAEMQEASWNSLLWHFIKHYNIVGVPV